MCYVFSVVSYGCETLTYSKAIDHKINALKMWCYRRMLRISRLRRNLHGTLQPTAVDATLNEIQDERP